MKNQIFIPVMLLILGCGGLKVSKNHLKSNKSIPDDLKNRTFWEETDIFKYKLEQLTGSIIYTKDSGAFSRGPRIIDLKNPPELSIIKNGLLYHSLVNNKLQGNISVLNFTVGLDSSQVVEVRIVDVMQAFIDFEKIPAKKIRESIGGAEMSGYKKYYVQGALLTSITKQYSHSIKYNTKGVIGSVFGADGQVFNEESDFIQDYKISLLLIDLDKYTLLSKGSNYRDDDLENQRILRVSVSKEIPITSMQGF